MTFLFASGAAPARRAALCALALLLLALGSTAVASAADGATGTVVVQQVAVGGSPAPGGCYTITRTRRARPGLLDVPLRPQRRRRDGRARRRRAAGRLLPPAGGRAAGGVQAVAPGTFSVLSCRDGRDRHRHPYARAAAAAACSSRTTRTASRSPAPAGGSTCPAQYEGYIAEACDDDDGADDGTTTFTTIRPGAYEIRHMESPSPFHRLDDVTPFAMPDAEKTLTFTLEREIAPVNTAPPTVTGQAEGRRGAHRRPRDVDRHLHRLRRQLAALRQRGCELHGDPGHDRAEQLHAHGRRPRQVAAVRGERAQRGRPRRRRFCSGRGPLARRADEHEPAHNHRRGRARPAADREPRHMDCCADVRLPVAALRRRRHVVHQRRPRDRLDLRAYDRRRGFPHAPRRHRDQRRGLGDGRLRRDGAAERRPSQPGAAGDPRLRRGRRAADRVSGLVDLALRRAPVRLPLAALQGRRHERLRPDRRRGRGRLHRHGAPTRARGSGST